MIYSTNTICGCRQIEQLWLWSEWIQSLSLGKVESRPEIKPISWYKLGLLNTKNTTALPLMNTRTASFVQSQMEKPFSCECLYILFNLNVLSKHFPPFYSSSESTPLKIDACLYLTSETSTIPYKSNNSLAVETLRQTIGPALCKQTITTYVFGKYSSERQQ